MKTYVYIEYNKNSMSEKLIKVSTDIEVVKKYLKARVSKYFNCPWNEIEKQYFFDSDYIFSDTFVNYRNSENEDFIFEIIEGETI